MKRTLLLLCAGAAVAGCGLALDYDDISDLPCPCDTDHVCLNASDRCVPRRSVELFKSCSTDTDQNGDELCPNNAICISVNGQGPRCLPQCTPTSYATPEADAIVQSQCNTVGTTCWATERGGVCSEGVCNTLSNDCGPGARCEDFNGAGICFTECNPWQRSPLDCGGEQACHPIGASGIMACVPAGTLQLGEICKASELCRKTDDAGRPMICDRALNSENMRRCVAICRTQGECIAPGEQCVTARLDINPTTGEDLGICEGTTE